MDHSTAIVDIASNYELDLFLSASASAITLRAISTNKYFRRIIPQLSHSHMHIIYKILLSPRGYVIILARSKYSGYGIDIIAVYSINGEKIGEKQLTESLNGMVLDYTGYYIVRNLRFFYTIYELDYWGNARSFAKTLHYYNGNRRLGNRY